jgi:hypothetical protein
VKRFLLAAVVLLAGCGSVTATTGRAPASATPVITQPIPTPPAPGTPALRQVHDPGHVTGTLTGPCHARDGGQLPDPRCTPGAYDPAVTAAVLCAPGYTTRSYRPPSSETDRFKYDVAFPAYGLARIPGEPAELDHLVPLELGGANDASNLWIEPGRIPNAKDALERRLHDAVCAGRVTLRAAQTAIARNWTTAVQVLGPGGAS